MLEGGTAGSRNAERCRPRSNAVIAFRFGGGSRHYGGGKHYNGKHYNGKHYSHGHGHNYYRRGHGYGYWCGGVWIATGIVGYGAGSYCSRLYECQ